MIDTPQVVARHDNDRKLETLNEIEICRSIVEGNHHPTRKLYDKWLFANRNGKFIKTYLYALHRRRNVWREALLKEISLAKDPLSSVLDKPSYTYALCWTVI
jgi:hypothetical protein